MHSDRRGNLNFFPTFTWKREEEEEYLYNVSENGLIQWFSIKKHFCCVHKTVKYVECCSKIRENSFVIWKYIHSVWSEYKYSDISSIISTKVVQMIKSTNDAQKIHRSTIRFCLLWFAVSCLPNSSNSAR